MYTEMALTARKFALTLAVTGIATMGSIALAPSASAAPADAAAAHVVQDGPGTVIEKLTGNGPDQFLIGEHGRKPIFICDEDGKHAKKCKDLTGPTRF
jgi:hypothetical protein